MLRSFDPLLFFYTRLFLLTSYTWYLLHFDMFYPLHLDGVSPYVSLTSVGQQTLLACTPDTVKPFMYLNVVSKDQEGQA